LIGIGTTLFRVVSIFLLKSLVGKKIVISLYHQIKNLQVMITNNFDIKELENTIKFIFNKKEITQVDIETSNKLIEKWKRITHWVEKTENPIKQ
jgi:hypothetical protein